MQAMETIAKLSSTGQVQENGNLLKWYAGQIKKNPDTLQKYERNNSEYIDSVVKKQKLPAPFSDLSTRSREDFLGGLKRFQQARPGFLTNILNRELASQFWFL